MYLWSWNAGEANLFGDFISLGKSVPRGPCWGVTLISGGIRGFAVASESNSG
jgi:hypothetical protein